MALEGAYNFDDVGSTTVVDHSGNGRDINLSGANGVQVDSVGILDGGALGKTASGTVSLPTTLLAATETDDRTLMFDANGLRSVWWIRWESVDLDTGVWGALSLDAANVVVRARDQSNNGPSPSAPTIGALGNGTRHNFAITYTRSTGVVVYYYDGVSIGTATFTAGTALYVGADDLNVAEWSSTGPAIDNLRFYSHALTAGEVAALAGTPVSGATEVTGTATATLGALTGVVVGTRSVTAVATVGLGALNGAATGTRTVDGDATTDLGALVTTVSGTVIVTGVATTNLDSLTGTVTGVRAVDGDVVIDLGALVATLTGTRTVGATAVTSLGTLTATVVSDVVDVNGVAVASLGRVIATTVGRRTVDGVAVAALGRLIATVVHAAELPNTRLRVSGREPRRRVSGREPRRSV